MRWTRLPQHQYSMFMGAIMAIGVAVAKRDPDREVRRAQPGARAAAMGGGNEGAQEPSAYDHDDSFAMLAGMVTMALGWAKAAGKGSRLAEAV